jgi:flagellar hook-basal body complex protein FliE
MNVSGLDSVLAQMRSAMAAAQGVAPLGPQNTVGAIGANGATDFASVMRTAMANAQGGVEPADAASPVNVIGANGQTDFGAVIKAALDKVAQEQNHAESLQHAFVLGDPTVSLSDVMLDTQKASMSHQKIAQVRAKVVAAYTDIMNQQI